MTDRQMVLMMVDSMEQLFVAWLVKNNYSMMNDVETRVMINTCYELVEDYVTREEFIETMVRHVGKDGKVCMQ